MICSYSKAIRYFSIRDIDTHVNIFPSIITGWDHTPRSGKEGLVFTGYTPQLFSKHVDEVFSLNTNKSDNIIFIKSWNEWAEGNYIEPDMKLGNSFLIVLRDKFY